jgi:hypothetical protein
MPYKRLTAVAVGAKLGVVLGAYLESLNDREGAELHPALDRKNISQSINRE